MNFRVALPTFAIIHPGSNHFFSMTYRQTIDYLYAQLPMYSRIGAAAYKADLDNTVALCAALKNPHKKFKSIHIAGTNGKGSTSHMLAAILQAAGYKTGLYTSPHIKDFRERIKINGEMISEEFVVRFVEQTKNISEQIKPSFFELTVAMAFDYFAKEAVDIAIIETGLGGRLDSTNIITPILSIITNIGFDHMDLLGDTLEKIAAEKAGIIKPGVPVVIGEYLPQTREIFTQKAIQAGSALSFPEDEYRITDIVYGANALSCSVTHKIHEVTERFELDLNGLYQVKNLRTVLCAEGILIQLGFTITNDSEKTALRGVKKLTGLRGRWDLVRSHPSLILDVAHNTDGFTQLLEQLALVKAPDAKTHFILGFVKDKDIEKILGLLPADAICYFSNAHIERALPLPDLMANAKKFGLGGDGYDDVNEAIQAAITEAAPDDIIVVCGSVFLVAEVDTERFADGLALSSGI